MTHFPHKDAFKKTAIASMLSTLFKNCILRPSIVLTKCLLAKLSAADLFVCGKGLLPQLKFEKLSHIMSHFVLVSFSLTPDIVYPFPRTTNLQQITLWTSRQQYKKSIQIKVLIKPFPHTTILHQMTLNMFCQTIENLYN